MATPSINRSAIPGLGPVPVPAPVSVPAAPYALYTPQAVGVATFLGTPLAGAIFMAINYRRLGKGGAAVAALLVGALVTAVLMVLGVVISSTGLGTGLAIAGVLGTVSVAKSLQGPFIEQQKAAGGKIASPWVAAGVGVLLLGIMFGVIYLVVVMPMGTHVSIGINEIYYKGTATEADAKALGKALQDLKFFTDKNPKSVFLSKSAQGTVISYVVVDPAAVNKPEIMSDFTMITATVGPAAGGKPLSFKLIDPNQKELKSQTLPQ